MPAAWDRGTKNEVDRRELSEMTSVRIYSARPLGNDWSHIDVRDVYATDCYTK